MQSENHRYTPCYCEENIWYLAGEERFRGGGAMVVLISGRECYRRLWYQASALSPGLPVWWDYHVVLLSYEQGWWVWDLDTTLGLPVPADTYFNQTFLPADVEIAKNDVVLRLINAEDYLHYFSSDRSHMKLPTGEWAAPPPVWPMIVQDGGSSLLDWLDVRRGTPGQVLTLAEFMSSYLSS